MHTKTFCRIRQQEEPSEENDMNSKEFLRLVTNIFTRSVFFFLPITKCDIYENFDSLHGCLANDTIVEQET
mgnify:CR=1 FL=1